MARRRYAVDSTTFHFGFRAGPEISRANIRFEDGRQPELDLVVGLHFGIVVGWDAGPFGILDATFAAGVGISIRLPYLPIRFSPEIRYVNDLTGIYSGGLQTDDGGIVETAESVKSNALRVGVLLGI